MPRDRSRCPNCGERVSPYAAGCAVCGADLDPSRWDSGPSAGRRLVSSLNAFSFGGLSQPVKFFLIGPMFRYSAPQKGRYREFWQLDFEAMGSDDPAVDAELVQLFTEIARRARVRYTRLEINSIGDRRCRPRYVETLVAFLRERSDALDQDARRRAETSPLRVFDTKDPSVAAVLADAPRIGDSLCEECRGHFDAVLGYLGRYGVAYEVRPTLVRGLDYYTRTVFEFVNDALDAAQSTICAGGRYDYLIEEIGGAPTPGVGWAAGVERMVLSREDDEERPSVDVFVALAENGRKDDVLPLLATLRGANLAAETDYAGRSLKGQLTHAGRLNARYTVIFRGADEPAEVWERGGTHERVAARDLERHLLGRAR